MAFTPPPVAPDPNDPSTFADRCQAMVAWYPVHIAELNAQGYVPQGIIPNFLTNMNNGAANLTLTSGASPVKVPFDTETYDIGGQFDAVTNLRYVTAIAGRYHFTATIHFQAATLLSLVEIHLYKNGATLVRKKVTVTGTDIFEQLSFDINSSVATDYFEIFVTATGTGALTVPFGFSNRFSGFYTGP